MTKNWKFFEKLIIGLQILFGFLLIVTFLYLVNQLITTRYPNGSIPWSFNLILVMVISSKSIILMSFLVNIASILWYKNKPAGWILSSTVWLLLVVFSIIRIFTLDMDSGKFISLLIVNILFALFSIGVSISLLNKRFWQYYKPSKSLIIICILLFFILTTEKVLILFT